MMDRALGAIVSSSTAPTGNIEAVNRFGMHYQWGRKDPFTPATTNYKEVQLYTATGEAIKGSSNGIGGEFTYEARTTKKPTTINDLIENPSIHYAEVDETNTVPIASTGDLKNDWWNPATKTIYDPCPNGYRIPESGTYNGFPKPSVWSADLINGMIWHKDTPAATFVPASGCRGAGSGKFYAVGSNGYGWMSTPYSPTGGYYLDFHSSAVYPNNYNSRASGIPVRCIRD